MNGLKVVLTTLVLTGVSAFSDSIDLAGQWRFAMDPEDKGQTQQWYQAGLPGEKTVALPGSMQEQGYGFNPGPGTSWTGDVRDSEWNKPGYAPYRTAENFKMPFWLQPDKYYKGAAWYQKKVSIPKSWKSKRIILTLERPHWQTTVWVDSQKAGSLNYLSVGHTYDLTDYLTPGSHLLTICVDNREVVDVGVNSHSISDHTQSNWNGIVGRIQLNAESSIWIEDVQVYPDLAKKSVTVKVAAGNRTGQPLTGKLAFDVTCSRSRIKSVIKEIKLDAKGGSEEVVIPLGETISVWDEFTPNLYTLATTISVKKNTDQRQTVFGMREVSTRENRIILNDHPAFMRGTLECCIFPKTGYPPTDLDSWKRIINICKSHGLNHIRFHSWCPPEAAFVAADELGFYYQVECSSWCNYGSGKGVGNGKTVDQWLYNEADAILKAYGNHPSFVLFVYGNEPDGPEQGAVYLRKWVSHYKQKDSRRLVTSGSGWPMLEESDYHVTPSPRIQQWGEELRSRINGKDPETITDYRDFVKRYPNQPVIAHEIGQWCVYPNFEEMKKYTGVLKTKNFEIFQDFLKQKQMLDQAHDFLMASGKLQTLCYKEDIESALRTPHFGGFQLLDLHDFPGQGTALVGVLDPFWDSKPYVSPSEYKRFCDAVVPLVRLPKRIFKTSDTLSAQVEISQFGAGDLIDAKVQWSLMDAKGQTLKRGVLTKDKMPVGDLYPVGSIELPLADVPAPASYKLTVALADAKACNDWDIWVYPDTVDTAVPAEITIASNLDESVIAKLQAGGKVLLLLKPSQVKTGVKIGFSSVFWNTAWTDGQAPHTLGILCDPSHPALAGFPTEYHSNWQWSEPIRNAAAMELDGLPTQLKPIVQVVPDWFDPKRLGLVFEAKVGKGSLVVCSINLQDHLEKRLVIRQLKHSLLEYMKSEAFAPKTEVDVQAVQSLFKQPSKMEKLGAAIIRVDSFERGHDGNKAIDGDPATLWHTQWSGEKPTHPHEIIVGFNKPVQLKGLTYLPRQDGNSNGWIKDYAVYISNQPDQWQSPAARGEFDKTPALKTIHFSQIIEGQYLRLVSEKGFGDDVFTSVAEMDLILE